MNYYFLVSLIALATPFVAGSYVPERNSESSYQGLSRGLDITNAAAVAGNPLEQNAYTSTAIDNAGLNNMRAQVNMLNADPTYQNMKNSESVAESLAENSLAKNIRQGNLNIVPPFRVQQDIYRSVLLPSGRNNHQVIVTEPMPNIIVNQPGAAPAQINSGPAAVIRVAPVMFKMRPSVIFQQEVINKVPTPLSLNPVYVKVYKPGKKIDVPVGPVVKATYPQPSYGHNSYAANSYSAPSYDGYAQQPEYAPKY